MKIVFEQPVVNVVELATGPKGYTGPASTIPGPPNTLTAGTITQIPAGGQPTFSVTGTAPNQTLNLGLVDGANGIGVPTTGNNPGDLLRWNGTVWIQTATKFHEGTGNPNGVVSAPIGSTFVNTEAGGYNGARRWTKATGSGNTGWVVVDGDTGWVDIQSYLTADWVKQAAAWANCHVKRTADEIYYLLQLQSTKTSGATATNVAIATGLPTWTRPLKLTNANLGVFTNPSAAGLIALSSGAMSTNGIGTGGTYSVNTLVNCSCSMPADPAIWPTSL